MRIARRVIDFIKRFELSAFTLVSLAGGARLSSADRFAAFILRGRHHPVLSFTW